MVSRLSRLALMGMFGGFIGGRRKPVRFDQINNAFDDWAEEANDIAERELNQALGFDNGVVEVEYVTIETFEGVSSTIGGWQIVK